MRVKRLLTITLLSLFACAAVWAQATAQIHGTVQDATGAAVPGAAVKATQSETGVSRTVNSEADGAFVLTNLPLGPYQIEVTKDGFTKALQSGIVLQVNSDPAVSIALKVGAVTEEVNVEANAALVETRNSSVGAVVETQRIVELPLNGRNVTDLITLSGAAVQFGSSDTRLFSNRPYLSIGGMAALPIGGGATDWIYDGASHYDFMTGTALPIGFPDAVQEFKVESTGLEAVHGNSAAVEVVTPSGSNAFHGDLFEFIRNDGFGSAREDFSAGASTYKRNQFGGTAGGPIKKNKLFFFGGYQGTTQRARPRQYHRFRSHCRHDERRFYCLRIGRLQPAGGTQGAIREQCDQPIVIVSAGLVYWAAYPYRPGPRRDHTECVRADHLQHADLRERQSIRDQGRLSVERQAIPVLPRSVDQAIPAHSPYSRSHQPAACRSGTGFNTPAYAYTVGDTYLFTSNLVNSFRVAFTRINETRPPDDYFNFCTAGVQNFWCGENTAQFGLLTVSNGFSDGTNYSDPPPNGGGAYYRSAIYSLNDDVSWVRGAHQMTFGGSAWQGRVTSRNDFNNNGQFTFTGGQTGQGLSDFLVGGKPPLFWMAFLPSRRCRKLSSIYTPRTPGSLRNA